MLGFWTGAPAVGDDIRVMRSYWSVVAVTFRCFARVSAATSTLSGVARNKREGIARF